MIHAAQMFFKVLQICNQRFVVQVLLGTSMDGQVFKVGLHWSFVLPLTVSFDTYSPGCFSECIDNFLGQHFSMMFLIISMHVPPECEEHVFHVSCMPF
jgi:hypothetical protein